MREPEFTKFSFKLKEETLIIIKDNVPLSLLKHNCQYEVH